MNRIYSFYWRIGWRMCKDAAAGCDVRRSAGDKGFSLIELLVVIGIIALLLAILVPVLRKARFEARKLLCVTNLRSIGVAIHAYANDHNDSIPFGPEKLSNFYTAKGNVTSLLSLYDGTPVGLGLLKDSYLADQPKVLFCPATDQRSIAKGQFAKVDKPKRVQGDYYYRHASVALLSGVSDEYHIRLSNLGKNRNGYSISALAMDVQFLAHPSMSGWGIDTRTAHRKRILNTLLADGQVITADNTQDEYTVDAQTSPLDSLENILLTFEKADRL